MSRVLLAFLFTGCGFVGVRRVRRVRVIVPSRHYLSRSCG
jgi:hypothetical protein